MPPRQKLRYVDDPVRVAKRIQKARLAAGLKQRDLSFPGCTAAYVSRIEKGERVPSLQILREFARRLGVSESYLATGRHDRAAERSSASVPSQEVRAALRFGEVEEARRLIDGALSRASSDAERATASALFGEVALYESDATGAIDALERAYQLDPQIELRDPGVAESLGRAYARANEYESAIGVFLRNYQAAKEHDDLLERTRFGSLLANAYADSGNFVRAEEVLGDLISVGSDLADPLARARIYWTQSRMHSLRGDEEQAIRHATRAMDVLEFSDESYHFALAHQLLAHIEINRGNVDRAVELLDQAAPLVAFAGRPFERASLELERARALLKRGDAEAAAALAMEAVAILETASTLDAGRGYALIAGVFAELADEERAIELYELAIERLETGSTRYLAEAYAALADLYERRDQPQKALALLRRAMKFQSSASGQPAAG
jgi:tetratricopeptide (TPR) repeat protein